MVVRDTHLGISSIYADKLTLREGGCFGVFSTLWLVWFDQCMKISCNLYDNDVLIAC